LAQRCDTPLLHTHPFLLSFLPLRPPPASTLFPYTTLFRSLLHLRGRSDPVGRDRNRVGLRYRPHRAVAYGRRGFRDRAGRGLREDRKSTRLNSSHVSISYAVFCLKKKKI